METATKLRATMKQNSDDRFSDLPDEIVHQILSHLPTTDLARVSVLSKRLRELCISNPTLVFSNCDVECGGSISRFSLCCFLDWLMALRREYKVKTQRFHLEWAFEPGFRDEGDDARAWLQDAVNSGVEEIYFNFYSIESFFLPPCVLDCKSLRSLEIEADAVPFRLPSSLSVPSFADKLQVLVLTGLNTDNQSLEEWLSSLKSLRVLKLYEVEGIEIVTITSSSVETLKIVSSDQKLRKIDVQKVQKLHHLFIHWDALYTSCGESIKISAPNLQSLSIIWKAPFSNETSLGISAPNLQTFQWFGYTVVDYCMENSPNLSYASLALRPRDGWRADFDSNKHSLEKVLHSIHGVKSLTLWNDFVEDLYVYECLPFLFGNLEHLAIRETSSREPVEPLSSLLRGIINLKHLILITSSESSNKLDFEIMYKEFQNFRFAHLPKTIAVKFFDGKSEVEQIEHVLKNAKELEVVILSTSPVPQDFIAEFEEFIIPFNENYYD